MTPSGTNKRHRLLRLAGRLERACRYACAACQSARQADLAPLTVMALENRALCALERKDAPRALVDAEEALQLVKPQRVYNVMRLRALTLRAHCRLEGGDPKGAARDLNSAGRLESNLVFSGTGGAIAAQARRLEIQAELHIQQGSLTRAVHNLKRAIALRRRTAEGCCGPSPYAIEALARALERLAGISKRRGDEAGSEAASHEAETLRRHAHLPLTSPQTGSAVRSGRRRGPGGRPKRRSRF